MMKCRYLPRHAKSLAVLYLARGADADHMLSFRRFAQSYRSAPACADHALFIIFKGFRDEEHLRTSQGMFSSIDYAPIHTADDAFDIGAYLDAARQIPHDRVCCLNTHSELLAAGWLAKLAANLDQPGVGLVGATGSFESLRPLDQRFPDFPNIHVRSNAFLMDRQRMLGMWSDYHVRDKFDAWMAESGPDSLTRRVFAEGMTALLVGKNGRGYPPAWWAASQTFRQSTQPNLLVHDNVTRAFERMPWSEKKERSAHTWGKYLDHEATMLLPG